jgi:hypothetical protein
VDCKAIVCGNTVTDPGEECDDGANGNDADGCRNDCKLNYCGDGILDTTLDLETGLPEEYCDLGASNGEPFQNCNTNCLPTCTVNEDCSDNCEGKSDCSNATVCDAGVCKPYCGALSILSSDDPAIGVTSNFTYNSL